MERTARNNAAVRTPMKPRRHRSTSHTGRLGPPEPAALHAARGGRGPLVLLRVLTAAGLGADAVLHAQLAPGYQSAAPDGIGEGNLFSSKPPQQPW